MWYGKIGKTALLASLLTVTAVPSAFASGDTVGDVFSNTLASWNGITNVLSTIAYFAGAFLAVAGVFKFKDHVDNPQQTKLSEGVKRMLAGGMFLSLPFMIRAIRGALFDTTSLGDPSLQIRVGHTIDGSNLSDGGLDKMVVDFMSDIGGPAEALLTGFSYIWGIAFLLVGISRLTKRMEEGPRGPAGMGTIMTFIASGVLFSFGDSMGAFANSMFGDGGNNLKMNVLVSNEVISDDAVEKITPVIEAVMGFVMLVGYIAFIRGWFVLRAFADGQQGATVAQGLTFLFGGTLAINLGQFVNMISNTVGVSALTFQ